MSENIALIKPEDLSLVENNSLNEKQLSILLKKTPAKYVRKRPAKGGGQWDYVSGGYIKKCLNLMFGWDWDFEIVDEQVLLEAKEVVVKGKLTCRSNGKTIVKMQYGNKDIVFRKGTQIPLSVGNDMKSAATDALKKCASEIGIAADIYNKEEFKEIHVDLGDNSPKVDPLIELKLKVVNALNAYEGEDKEVIRASLQEKEASNGMTEEYLNNILESLN